MRISYERYLNLNFFKQNFKEKFVSFRDIAYFGPNSIPDHELNLFKKQKIKFYSIGIEKDNSIKFDINFDVFNFETKFDLVIVSNVFEHIWNKVISSKVYQKW